MRSKAGDKTERDHLEHPSERFVGLPQTIDLGDHLLRGLGVEAPHGRLVDVLEVLRLQIRSARRTHARDLDHVAVDADAERGQKRLADGAADHPSSGLPCAGALEDVTHVAEAVLLCPDKVGVTRARQVNLGHIAVDRPRVHSLLPVGVVAVAHLKRDRPAERAAVPDPARHLDSVALDLHPTAAAMSELASLKVAVERVAVELEPGRHPLEDARQARAVRLAGGCEAERHCAPRLRALRRRQRPDVGSLELLGVAGPSDGEVAGHRSEGTALL